MKNIILPLTILALSATATRAADVSFSKDVKAIFAHRCYECHANGKRKGGFDITSRESLLKGGEDGPALVPGKSVESELLKRITSADTEKRMPPKGDALEKSEIATISAWIDQGAKWDEAAPLDRAQKVSLAIKKPAIPAGEAHPVDALIGLKGGVAVDDLVFARRAWLDVIGLQPTLAELEAFSADKSPDKRAQLVKKLLANNEGYAAHWMSFWSDLLRNGTTLAGIDGHKNVNITPWLLKSLKENKPYDAFAASLISPTAETDAFINGVVMRGVVPPSQVPEMQAAIGVAQVFLGVQLKCAACHDSFVSRWTLADAYGMASVFSDKPMELIRCEIPQGKKADPRFLYSELGAIKAELPRAERLKRLAELTTSPQNGQFARTIVNRLWGRLFGRAIVEPVDDMENQPWNAALLDFLAADLVEHKFDVKHSLETIMSSKAYGLRAHDSAKNAKDYKFAGPHIRRLTAEQFVDAVYVFTGRPGRVYADKNNPLLENLARPDRNTVATTRETESTTLQMLELINGPDMQRLVYSPVVYTPANPAAKQKPKGKAPAKKGAETKPADPAPKTSAKTEPAKPEPPPPPPPPPILNRLKGIVEQETGSKTKVITRLYHEVLLREPTPKEMAAIESALGSPVTPELAGDVLWSLLMLPEFQLIR